MNQKRDTKKSGQQFSGAKECGTCLFVDHSGAQRENCLRFARFVDHALHEASRGCDYWTPHREQ